MGKFVIQYTKPDGDLYTLETNHSDIFMDKCLRIVSGGCTIVHAYMRGAKYEPAKR